MQVKYKTILFTIFLLLVFMFVDYRNIFEIPVRMQSRPLLYQFVYYLNYLGLLISCLIFLTVKSKFIRYTFYLILFLTIAITMATDLAHNNSFGKIGQSIFFIFFCV